MVTGNITMSGTGKELLENPQVRAAYLEGGGMPLMQGILYEEPSIWLFLLVTVDHGRLGGLDDRARDRHHLAAVLEPGALSPDPGGFVRFIHFALFRGT